MRRLRWVALVAVLATVGPAGPAQAEQRITISPATFTETNCFPLSSVNVWPPYAAAFYKNIPAFELKPGDTVGFDGRGGPNTVYSQLDIALARTTSNGSTEPAEAFRTVVTNANPASSRGDDVAGNFEIEFEAEQPFSFPGGGLAIRFSNPAGPFADDLGCETHISTADAADESGYFVGRSTDDDDGVPPWENFDPTFVPVFQLKIADPLPPPTTPTTCQGATVPSTTGTEGEDDLLGTINADAIFGLGGNDELDGVDGDDCLDGGDGDDRASGGADDDLVKGGDGRDRVRGVGGKDRLKGQGGEDRVSGGEGRDRLSGGSGEDKLRGGAAKDALKGNSGSDDLNAVDAKTDRVNCGGGEDKAVVDPIDRVSRNCEAVREVEKN